MRTEEAIKDLWVGPRELTPQLATFAHYYVTAIGRERSLSKAAQAAGINKKSAPQMGYKWSKYSIVQRYWKDYMDATIGSRASFFESSLKRLEEIGKPHIIGSYNDKVSATEQIDACDKLAQHIENVSRIEGIVSESQKVSSEVVSENDRVNLSDSSTEATMGQILVSMYELRNQGATDK